MAFYDTEVAFWRLENITTKSANTSKMKTRKIVGEKRKKVKNSHLSQKNEKKNPSWRQYLRRHTQFHADIRNDLYILRKNRGTPHWSADNTSEETENRSL